MSSGHTVTIKHDAESHEYDCHDACEATVECSGVTDTCRVWWECDTCRAAKKDMTDERRDDYDEQLWDTSEAHGVEHQHIDCVWMTPGDSCLVYELETDASDLVPTLPDGVHPVGIDCDDGFVYVQALTVGAQR
jgi:hypothetical protein